MRGKREPAGRAQRQADIPMRISFVGHLLAWTLGISLSSAVGASLVVAYQGHSAGTDLPSMHIVFAVLSGLVAYLLPVALWNIYLSRSIYWSFGDVYWSPGDIPGAMILEGITAGVVEASVLLMLAWAVLGVLLLQPLSLLPYLGPVAGLIPYAVGKLLPDEDTLDLVTDSNKLAMSALIALVRALRDHHWLLALGLLGIGCIAALMWFNNFP